MTATGTAERVCAAPGETLATAVACHAPRTGPAREPGRAFLPRSRAVDVGLLILLSLISRGWGTWFDHAHFDEWAAVGQSQELLETGRMDVHMYGPGVSMWAVLPEFVSRGLGLADAGRYALHRIWEGVLPGTLTVVLLWCIAGRLTRSRWAAFVAGLLLICSFVHFEASHFAKADMLALALLMAPVAIAARRQGMAADGGGGRYVPAIWFAIIVGALIGLAVACRPNMAVFTPVWMLYFTLTLKPPRLAALVRLCAVYCVAAALAWGAMHVLCLRGVGWSVPRLMADVVRQAMVAKFTYATLCDRPWWYYFAPFGHDLPALGVGLPMVAAAVAGIVFARVAPAHRALWRLLVVLTLLYVVFLLNERVRLIRWAGPLVPWLCLFIAVLLHGVYGRIASGGPGRLGLARVVVAGAVVLLIAAPVRQMVLFDLSAGQSPTTLTAAKGWMDQHPGAKYGVFGCFGWGPVEGRYPYHYPAAEFDPGFDRAMKLMDWVGRLAGVEADRPEPLPKPDPAAILGPVELMQREGLDYIVVGGWRHEFLVHTPDAYAHDAEIKRRLLDFHAQARADLKLCARFAPDHAADWGMSFMGRQQTLEVYALPGPAAGPSPPGDLIVAAHP